MALLHAAVGEVSAPVRREIAGEIGSIAQRHDRPAAAIDGCWAKALSSVTVGEASAAVCFEIACEIGRIAQHHVPPEAAIDQAWATALYSATMVADSAPVQREIVGEIGRIAQRHIPPVAAIDELWAGVWMATISDVDQLSELPWRNEASRVRIGPRIIAVLEANRSEPEAALVIERLREILEEFERGGP